MSDGFNMSYFVIPQLMEWTLIICMHAYTYSVHHLCHPVCKVTIALKWLILAHIIQLYFVKIRIYNVGTVYPKKYAHGFPLLCFVVVIHWLIFPYPPGLLHWHCGNLTIAPVPAKQPWWIWINTSCEFIMNDCTTTTKQSTTKPCAYFLGYTVNASQRCHRLITDDVTLLDSIQYI